MTPGRPCEFLWSGEWYKAVIEKNVFRHRNIIQVALCEVDEEFTRDFLKMNKTALPPTKIRKRRK